MRRKLGFIKISVKSFISRCLHKMSLRNDWHNNVVVHTQRCWGALVPPAGSGLRGLGRTPGLEPWSDQLLFLSHHSQYHGMPGTERERNVLFNDALNTFYLQLYGVRHMVKVPGTRTSCYCKPWKKCVRINFASNLMSWN